MSIDGYLDIECCFGVSQYDLVMYGDCKGSPFIINKIPNNLQPGIDFSTTISADILDSFDILFSSIRIYIDNNLVFNGNSFIYPYIGTVTPTIVGLFKGFHLIIENEEPYNASNWITVRLLAENILGFDIDESWKFYTKTSIKQIEQGPYEITVDLTFSGPMYNDIEFTNSANYKFTNGAYARKIEKLNDDQVRIWTEYLYGHTLFDLSVFNVKDNYNFLIYENTISIAPFYSTASLGSYNGMIRTFHDSRFITSDSQRIYLAGSKGLDIFKTEKRINKTWAQVFDSYGTDSMVVVNYPNDLTINDNIPPYISYALPNNGGTAFSNTHIIFIISDLSTSIEISSLVIYINGILVFIGNNGGWQYGVSGNIDIGYKNIKVEFWLSTLFVVGTSVIVRIIADDLMKNKMDSSYSFTII
ncbi:MAG: hypothetical protein WC516_07160 [Patescibacteria group bacterium]|jgi:hypothetical protein